MANSQPGVCGSDVGIRILSGSWPDDAVFQQSMCDSWTCQYAEYLGQSRASNLVSQLLESGELYPGDAQPVLLAMIGHEHAGIAAYRSLRGLSLITMLEVIESYRHRGIGRRLVAAIQQQSGQRLLAHVSIHRPGVRAFYEKQEFRVLPRTRVDHYGHQLEFDVMAR